MKNELFNQYIKVRGEILAVPQGKTPGTVKISEKAVGGQIFIVDRKFLGNQEISDNTETEIILSIPMTFLYVYYKGRGDEDEVISYNDMYDADGGVPAPLDVRATIIRRGEEIAITFKSNKEREIKFMTTGSDKVSRENGIGVDDVDAGVNKVAVSAKDDEPIGCEGVVFLLLITLVFGVSFFVFMYRVSGHLIHIRENSDTMVALLRAQASDTVSIRERHGVRRNGKTVFEMELFSDKKAAIASGTEIIIPLPPPEKLATQTFK